MTSDAPSLFLVACAHYSYLSKAMNSGCISFKVLKLSWLLTAFGAFIFVEIYEWGCNYGCLIVAITEVSQIYLWMYINSDYTCETIRSECL